MTGSIVTTSHTVPQKIKAEIANLLLSQQFPFKYKIDVLKNYHQNKRQRQRQEINIEIKAYYYFIKARRK